MNNLQLRLLTAVVGGAIFIAGLMYSPQTAQVIALITCGFCAYEYCQILGKPTLWIALALVSTIALHFIPSAYTLNITLALLLVFLVVCLLCINNIIDWISKPSWGMLYVGLNWGLLALAIWQTSDYHLPLLWFLFLVWGSDLGGYIVGRAIGKHKMAPNISPNKTWEGFMGGLSFCLLISLYFILSYHYDWNTLIFAPMVHSCVVLGDLYESSLKRRYNLKDSGTLLPGHGGFLDRFDGFILAIPVGCLIIFMV